MGYMGDELVPSGITQKGEYISWSVTGALHQVVEEEGHPWDV